MDEGSIFHHEPGSTGPQAVRGRDQVHNFTDVVGWSYILWIGPAMLAALRVSGGQNVLGRRRA